MFMKNKKGLQKPIFALILVVVLLLTAVIYAVFFYPWDPTTTYTPEYPESITSQQDTTSTNQDKQHIANIPSTTSEEVPASVIGKIMISNLQQKNGFVNALATISDFDVKTCVYSFTSDGAKPVVKEQTNGCSGISIPQVEFEKIGLYTLTVTAYSPEQKISAIKEISIQ